MATLHDQGWNPWWAQVGIERPSCLTSPGDPPTVEEIQQYWNLPENNGLTGVQRIDKFIRESKALVQDEAGGGQPGLNASEKAKRAMRLADYRESREMLKELLQPMIEDFEKSLKMPRGGGTSQRKTKRRKSKRKSKRRKSKRRRSKTRRRSR
jgi:hypothetical protein